MPAPPPPMTGRKRQIERGTQTCVVFMDRKAILKERYSIGHLQVWGGERELHDDG
jgi:hypothetical protein